MAAELEAIDCVGSLAGANLGATARGIEAEPALAFRFASLLDSWAGPIDGTTGGELVAELVTNADRFDTVAAAPRLARKRVLLVAGGLDEVTSPAANHAPLVAALEQAGAASFEAIVLEQADHSFSGQRIALARAVTGWLVDDCGEGA